MHSKSRNQTKEDIQMANTHIKRCSTSHAIREMPMEATMRYCYTPMKTAKIQNTDSTKCWGGCGTMGFLSIAGENENGTATLESCLVVSYQTEHTFTIRSSHLVSRYYAKEWKTYPHKNLHTDVYSSFMHNCQSYE